MFIETLVALIPQDAQNQRELNELLGKEVYGLDEEYDLRPCRFRIDEVTLYYQSSNPEYLVIKLFDYDHCFLIKDDIRRIDAIINGNTEL